MEKNIFDGKVLCGVQLYTLRKHARTKEGLEKCFEFCAKAGAKAVQLSSVYEAQPDFLKELKDKYNLDICVTHKSFERITQDCAALCAEHKVYECDLIGVPSMPPAYRGSMEKVLDFCAQMNKAQRESERYGINLAYHNHAFEFNNNIYDTLIDNLDRNIKFILDTYWADFAGQDVFALMDRLSDRLAVLHLKDKKTVFNKIKLMRAPGKGEFDFAKILKYAQDNTACKYALIELDLSLSPFKDVEYSLNHLRKVYAD